MELSKLNWRKSSRSNESGDNCVEIASVVNGIVLRDSKIPDGPKLIINHGDFRHLANTLKNL
ncbi:DUF397 domain-containing protein [Spirillospora sp. NPDC047418]|jgi:hypothetical protein